MDDFINAFNAKKLEILEEIVNVGHTKTKFIELKSQEGSLNLVDTMSILNSNNERLIQAHEKNI
jgi:hypothetical protein